jgi:hypothetical protein
MSTFYGTYIKNNALSVVFDLIRFVAEPDNIRFSHITLRGPYKFLLSQAALDSINYKIDRVPFVETIRPELFSSSKQSTVVILIDLHSLAEVVYKPDFPNSVPHLTMYDAGDPGFARELYSLVAQYMWTGRYEVTPLQLIRRKHSVDGVFLQFFEHFYAAFERFVGDPIMIHQMSDISLGVRLKLIESILIRGAGPSRRPGVSALEARGITETSHNLWSAYPLPKENATRKWYHAKRQG